MNNLEEIALLIKGCTDCELSQGRNNAVPGEGSPQAELMFIGEGPGYHEDRLGRPFVGPAGQFLDSLLMSIGLKREDVFIANMVKCRPPQNRDPLPAEMSACSKYLNRQIELINPKLIVTLGRFSLSRFFPGESISRVRERSGKKTAAIYSLSCIRRRRCTAKKCGRPSSATSKRFPGSWKPWTSSVPTQWRSSRWIPKKKPLFRHTSFHCSRREKFNIGS